LSCTRLFKDKFFPKCDFLLALFGHNIFQICMEKIFGNWNAQIFVKEGKRWCNGYGGHYSCLEWVVVNWRWCVNFFGRPTSFFGLFEGCKFVTYRLQKHACSSFWCVLLGTVAKYYYGAKIRDEEKSNRTYNIYVEIPQSIRGKIHGTRVENFH
jgi:hypothetical protein